MNVIRFIDKTEEIEVLTSDGRYKLKGQLVSDGNGPLRFDGGEIVNQESGATIANIESWTRNGGVRTYISAGYSVADAMSIINGFINEFESNISTTVISKMSV